MFLILVITVLVVFVFYKIILSQFYWRRRGIKQGAIRFFGDSFGFIFKTESFAEMMRTVHNRHPNAKYTGIYQLWLPVLMLHDPETIKQITVKDFDHFTDHYNVIPDIVEPMWDRNLLSLKGEKWKHMRMTLTPMFTASKMRHMFEFILENSQNFVRHYESKQMTNVEFKDAFTRFTNDVIASCAFGLKTNSLEERENKFYLMGREITSFSGFWTGVRMTIVMAAPKLAGKLGISPFASDTIAFFKNVIRETMAKRKEQHIVRPDMIHLLMEARKATLSENSKHKIDDIDIAANALIFFFAGFDTASTLMCFLAYELAVNQEIQENLRKEIMYALKSNGGKFSYEMISGLKYLDMVISETLRKWPPTVASDRVCTKPYRLQPTSTDIAVDLNVGDVVCVPVFGLHRDPNFFPDPDKFDPNRFADDKKAEINPYAYVPFGVGPRSCIGNRFALLETKTVFCCLLEKFEIIPSEDSVIPVVLDTTGFNLNSKGGFHFCLKQRK